MREALRAFYSTVVVDRIVISGADARLPKDADTGRSSHTYHAVYRVMLLQIAREYPSLPDLRTLTEDDIRFFYDGLRHDLKKYTKDR